MGEGDAEFIGIVGDDEAGAGECFGGWVPGFRLDVDEPLGDVA